MDAPGAPLNEAFLDYLIVLCVIAVEALNLALLWLALRLDISRAMRPLLAGLGLSGAWGAWILVLVLGAPLGMTLITGLVFAASSVVMGITIHLATVEEERPDGGGGEAAPSSPLAPQGGGAGDPPWWPAFQLQMTEYAALQASEREPSADPVGSGAPARS